MLISLLISLLVSNAVLARDKSILFSRLVLTGLFLQTLLNRAYSNLELFLNSPPNTHAFESLPLQSSTYKDFS